MDKTEKSIIDFKTAKAPHILERKEKKIRETRAAFEKYYSISDSKKSVKKNKKAKKKK